MDRLSYLNPHTMKAQCDSAIEILEEQVEQLRKVEAAIDEFVAADEIKSSKFDALKQHMADYKTLIQAICSVNEEDIMDWKTLKEAVGDEILDGGVILEQKERAAYMEETNRSLGEYYDERRRDPNLFPEEVIEYEIRATEYYKLAESLRVIKEEWERKEESYDHIQENTGRLFPNAGLRRTIQSGIEDLKGAFRNGQYVPNMGAPWRTDLQKLYRERLMKELEDGSIIVDWEEVEKLMKKDADKISDMEYRVLAELYLMMDTKEMEKFLPLLMVEKEHLVWEIDEEKVRRLDRQIEGIADTFLYLEQWAENSDLGEDIINRIENQRKTIFQREALLEATAKIDTFYGEYPVKGLVLAIQVKKGSGETGDTLILKYKSKIVHEGLKVPQYRTLETCSATISPAMNGVNIDAEALEYSKRIMLGQFSVPGLSGEAAGFLAEEAAGQFLSEISEALAKETGQSIIGSFPVIGDMVSAAVGYQQEKAEAKEKIKIAKEQFANMEAAKVYGDFNCTAVYITYEKGKEKETNLRVGEGYDTMERIQKVNQACGTDITLEELLISPQTIEEKVENKKNSYNEALMDRD